MVDDVKDLFFRPKIQTIDDSKYTEIELLKKMCDAISSINNQSIYLVDYIRHTILHVSPHPLFLCGYEVEEVKEMGYSFMGKILSRDDLQMLIELNKMIWKFIYDCAPEEREHFCISYDIHFQHKSGERILVNQKIVPTIFTNDGDIWISVGIVNYSSHKNPGNVVFSKKDRNLYYTYNFNKKKFIQYQPPVLSKREEEILRLSMQGYSETDIGRILHLSPKTIKNHRYNTSKKFGVNNLVNTVSMFNLSF